MPRSPKRREALKKILFKVKRASITRPAYRTFGNLVVVSIVRLADARLHPINRFMHHIVDLVMERVSGTFERDAAEDGESA